MCVCVCVHAWVRVFARVCPRVCVWLGDQVKQGSEGPAAVDVSACFPRPDQSRSAEPSSSSEPRHARGRGERGDPVPFLLAASRDVFMSGSCSERSASLPSAGESKDSHDILFVFGFAEASCEARFYDVW